MTELKTYSVEDVKKHNKPKDCWIIIYDKVYDVSKFLDEHPGGEEVLIDMAGKVATENFEDVGHSSDAREMMKDYCIGELSEEDKKKVKEMTRKLWAVSSDSGDKSSWYNWLVPLGLAFVASMVYRAYMQSNATK